MLENYNFVECNININKTETEIYINNKTVQRFYKFLKSSLYTTTNVLFDSLPSLSKHVSTNTSLGVVCFFEAKMFEVCGPPLQPSVTEERDQTVAACNKKFICFLTSTDCCNKLN